MPITFYEKTKIFQIDTDTQSYVMQIKYGYLHHLYWGAYIGEADHSYMSEKQKRGGFSPSGPGDEPWSPDTARLEYPVDGTGDMRISALDMVYADGSMASELVFREYEIVHDKPCIEGLPQILADGKAQTLIIVLEDRPKNIEVQLSYSIIAGYEAIVRSVKVVNNSSEAIKVTKCMSASVDIGNRDFDEIHLHGAWARERYIERAPITHGIKRLESRRGASGHQMNPFVALAQKGTSENHGSVYGINLIYSGNFACDIEKDQYDTVRAMSGISPHCFVWNLMPGDSFQSPEAVLVHSEEGLGGMSHEYHRLYRDKLGRSRWKHKIRPVVVNNWEATYFDFDEQKILTLAGQAKKLGIDMIVMDDGWFGKRNDDKTSLGDWYENKEKLPGGLAELSQKVKQKGVAFGLWFEPEMVSPDSDLYRAHPDWCLQIKGRRQTLGRNQLLLDMSRGDVCDYLIERISDILRNVSIDYVKWDFNRNLTEVYSQTLPPERQGEVYHRFMLGTYYVLQKLNEAFLDVLFEGCSGGGGRFDPGMLYYSPQIWTSDDTDAVERIKIQYGTSLVYPMSAISSHVSAVPNHQTGRITPFDFRGDVAMTGAFGYELDLAKLTARECELVEKQIADYKRYCAIITGGRLYRLRSPFGANDAAWMVVSRDKCEALVSYFSFSAQPNAYMDTLPLEGLQGDFIYRDEQGNEYSGLQLMNFGIILPEIHGQYTSRLWHFKAIN